MACCGGPPVSLFILFMICLPVRSEHVIHLRHHTLHVGNEFLRRDEIQIERALDAAHISCATTLLELHRSMMTIHQSSNESQVPWLVTVDGPIDDDLIAKITSMGCKFVDYVPKNTLLVVGPADESHRENFISLPRVVHATVIHHGFKAPRKLTSLKYHKKLDVTVHILEDLVEHHGGWNALVGRWKHDLQRMSGRSVRMSWVSTKIPRIYIYDLEAFTISRIMTYITKHALVLTVEERKKPQLQNQWARYIIQTDRPGDTLIWSNGIKGQDEVIAVADTGIDHDSCWFVDLDRPVPMNTVDHNHRKIVYYNSSNGLGDDKDVRGGHGSHVVGSLLGRALKESASSERASKFNGMAPEAKVAFFDYQNGHSFDVPEDLYHDYYEVAYTLTGARIMSNSWGTDPNKYDVMSMELDTFLFDHPDFLAVMAAGNYGKRGYSTLSSPGNAKNCLTIGATRSSVEAWKHWGNPVGLMMHNGDNSNPHTFRVNSLNGYRKFESFQHVEQKESVVLSKSDACRKSSYKECDGCVIFAPCTSACSVGERITFAQAAGATFVLFERCSNGLSLQGSNATIGAGILVDYSSASQRATGTRISLPIVSSDWTKNELAMPNFSSKGPSSDGRNKPDVLAPGEYTESIRSDGHVSSQVGGGAPTCGATQKMEGTSMATPIGAGGAALVRQYFREGYYPSGRKTSKDRILNPMAAMLKAAIINGAEPMGAQYQYWISRQRVRTDSIPSPLQGYGRMKLESTLYFASENKVNGPLFILHEDNGIRTHQLLKYCIKVDWLKSPVFIKATLVWTDHPASKLSGRQLVNNLDLSTHIVMASGGASSSTIGNQLRKTDNLHHNKQNTAYDEINNVEQVAFWAMNMSHIEIHVFGKNIPKGPQKFGLALSARIPKNIPKNDKWTDEMLGFDETDVWFGTGIETPLVQLTNGDSCGQALVRCPNQCSNQTCMSNGRCKCVDSGGVDCSIDGERISFTDGHFEDRLPQIKSDEWKYFKFRFEKTQNPGFAFDHLAMKIELEKSKGNPHVYVKRGGIPSYDDYDMCYACKRNDGKEQQKSEPIYVIDIKQDIYWVHYAFSEYFLSYIEQVGVTASCCVETSAVLKISLADFDVLHHENKPNKIEDSLAYIGITVV